MQNAVNYLCPFFGRDGKPIVNGRVYFVDVDTDAQTFADISGLDFADFIHIYDADGTELENPLPLDDLGQFGTQPFVQDGTDFKMIVCAPTGIDPDLYDQTPAWEVVWTMVSKAQHIEIELDGVPSVDSIAALRQLEPNVDAVLVLGYYSKGDFCPPRIFTWKQSNLTDNGGTHIRSSVDGYESRGTWVCEPSGFVDVRWFGVDGSSSARTSDDYPTVLNIVQNYYPNLPVCFPAGYYNISQNMTIPAMVLDKGAYIRPLNQSVTLAIDWLENRGGFFGRARNANNAYVYAKPKVKGILYSSWCVAPGAQISDSILNNVTELIFDSDATYSEAETIHNKRVLVKSGAELTNVSFEECEVFYENSGLLRAKIYDISDKARIDAFDIEGLEFKLKYNAALQRILLLNFEQSEMNSDLKLPSLQIGDNDDFQDGWRTVDDWFEGKSALYSHYAYLLNLVAGSLTVNTGISHAKSSRKKIVITLTTAVFRVVVPDIDVMEFDYTNNVVDLTKVSRLIDGVSTYFDIFEGARDWDLFVDTNTINSGKTIILPKSDGEKIVAVYVHAGGSYPDGKAFLEQYDNDDDIQVLGYQNPVTYKPVSFAGLRVIRKEANGLWFFDPFAI